MLETEPVSHSFRSHGLTLHYVDWGNAGAPALVLLHGNRDHCRSWDWTARALRRDWHVVALDLRGHGDSEWAADRRYDFAGFVTDLAELVAHLGVDKIAILAHSMGSHLALRFAAIYPERVSRMVLVEPVGAPLDIEAASNRMTPAQRMRDWIEGVRAIVDAPVRRFATVEDALARMMAANPHLTEEQGRHLTVHGLVPLDGGGWRWKYDPVQVRPPFPDVGQIDVDALWGAVRCPAGFIYGTESWPSSLPARIVCALPDAPVVTIEQAGHWPHHDQFDRFIDEAHGLLAGFGPA